MHRRPDSAAMTQPDPTRDAGDAPTTNRHPPAADEVEREFVQVASSGARKLLVLLVVVAAALMLLHFTPLGERVRDWPAYYELLADGGAQAALYFVLLTAGLMAVGTPRLLFYALGGFAFGFWEGLLLSLCGSLLGSFIAFRTVRWGGRGWLAARFGHRRFLRYVVATQPTVWSVALIRFLPVSNAVLNVGLALSRTGNRAFLLGTLIGFLPQGVVAALVGSGMADGRAWEGSMQFGAVAGVVVVLLVCSVQLARWSLRRQRAEIVEHALDVDSGTTDTLPDSERERKSASLDER
jgi:uncharacterized membrane protein YdjX (TVP38/TMEM64 family)